MLKCIKFLVRKNKTLKKYWKMETNTGKVREKSGNFVSPEKWEPCVIEICGVPVNGIMGIKFNVLKIFTIYSMSLARHINIYLMMKFLNFLIFL